jgi:DUF4097 and DUF4098 domain-containing protein YvlB
MKRSAWYSLNDRQFLSVGTDPTELALSTSPFLKNYQLPLNKNEIMRKMHLLLLLFIPVALLQAQSNKQPFLSKSLSGESITSVEAKTTGGNISVSAVGQSESRVEVYVTPGNSKDNGMSKEEIQKRLEEHYELSVTVSGNNVRAIAKPKERNMNWKKALNISFQVFVTKNVSSDLTTSGGNIKLSGISGTQDFTTSGGNIDLDNLAGKITGRTSGGNIRLSNSKDDIDLTTSGGNINAENSDGKLRLVTSGGSLSLKRLKGNIKATTSGGNIYGEYISDELSTHTSGGNVSLREMSCNLETSTSGGNIDVEMKELFKYVNITNSSGNIDLQMPGNKGVDLKLKGGKIKTSSFSNFSGSVEDDHIDGKLNGGGSSVKVSAGSGRINLSLTK